MNIQEIIDDNFFSKGEFFFKSKQIHGVCISNNTLEWCKTKGLDIHYEVQKDGEEQLCVRLDCHFFPYNEFMGGNASEKLRTYYSANQAAKIEKRKRSLEERYSQKQDEEGIKYRREGDYWWLAKSEIQPCSTKEEILSAVYSFIAKTYPTLIAELKLNGIIEE